MTEKTLASGRPLVVNIAPFSAANKLRRIVAAELLKVEIEAGKLDLNVDLKNLDSKALNTLKNVVCQLMASEAVENSFFECAARSTIDGEAIKRDSFNAEEARGDFLPTAWEVIRANLAPFFASLDLSSLTGASPTKSAPP